MDDSMRWVIIFFVTYLVLILEDSLIIHASKRLLMDFLIGTRNRKSAMRIHLAQSPEQRKTMAYIKPLLKENVRQFEAFRKLYLIIRHTLIPQYALLIVCNIVSVFFGHNTFYLLAACVILKTAIAIFLRFQVDGSRRSKYAKGK